MVQPVDAHAESEKLTIEDLKASVVRRPRLGSDDIANTYYSDEEFLAALDETRGGTNSCSPP